MPNRNNTTARQGALPPLPADAATAYGFQAEGLTSQKNDTLELLRNQRGLLAEAFKNQRAAINRQRAVGLADAESNAIERGVLGSSGDFRNRLEVRANASSALAEAMAQRDQALLANTAQLMQAKRDFQLGMGNLAISQANDQAALVNQAFLTNSFLTPETLAGDNAGTQGLTNKQQHKLGNLSDSIKDLARLVAQAAPSSRSQFLNQLREAWAKRNQLRKKYGLSPFSQGKLDQLLQQAYEQYQTPGGLA